MTGVLGLNYAPPLRKFAQDPTVIFTSLVILTPLVYATSLEAGIQYMTTPMMLGSFAFLYGVLRVTHASKCVALSARDERVANWFLMNGVYFNLFLDVVSGQFQMMDEMSQQYRLVEPRYVMGVQEDGGQSVFMTSMLELFFQSPFCLLAYYGYHKGLASRRICEFFVCVLHMTGVWYFYIPEVLVSFRHLGGWPASLEEAISFDRVLHFWFAFWFCGILWLVVPSQIAHTAWKEICELISSVEYAPTVTVPKVASKAA